MCFQVLNSFSLVPINILQGLILIAGKTVLITICLAIYVGSSRVLSIHIGILEFTLKTQSNYSQQMGCNTALKWVKLVHIYITDLYTAHKQVQTICVVLSFCEGQLGKKCLRRLLRKQ